MNFDLCKMDGHEWVGTPEDTHELDQARCEVQILAPRAAVRNQPPERVCAGCAHVLAEAYIGFGYDVMVRRLDRG